MKCWICIFIYIALNFTGCDTDNSPAGGGQATARGYFDGSCVPEDDAAVQFVSPFEGQSLRAGDTLTIRWRVDATRISEALVYVSYNNGVSWSKTPIVLREEAYALSTEDFVCDSAQWVVGQSYPLYDPSSGPASCKLKYTIYAHIGETYAVTGTFIIEM